MRTLQIIFLCSLLFGFSADSYGQDYQLNGNLGVGTDPDAKLDVDGDTKLRGDTEVEGDLKLKDMEGSSDHIWERIMYADDDGRMQRLDYDSWKEFVYEMYSIECIEGQDEDADPIWVNSTGDMLLCRNDDRVGIGVLLPSAQLHVMGNTVLQSKLTIGRSTPQTAHLHVEGDGLLTGAMTLNSMNLIDNGTNRFSLFPSGKMETYLATGESDFWRAYSPSGEYVYTVRSNGSFKTHLQDGAPSAFEAMKDGVEIFRLDEDGSFKSKLSASANRAISVFEPGTNAHEIFRVDPNGNLFSTKVTVELTPFPDYVFEDDYELMPLHELKKYIATNKHLPNLPTADHVRENGADLGELNRLLVEKVEELTLYVIQLQEQVDALNADAAGTSDKQ